MDSSTSLANLKAFHGMERRLFERLVIDMGKDLVVCMQVIALWLYFEEIGYPNLIAKMENLPDHVVNKICDEADYCLGFLRSLTRPPPFVAVVTDMPVTNYLMDNKHISAMVIFQDHKRALQRVVNTVTDVLFRAFDDILLLPIEKERNPQSNPHPTESQSTSANRGTEQEARSSSFGAPVGMKQEARSSFFGKPAAMKQEARSSSFQAPIGTKQETKSSYFGAPAKVEQEGFVRVPGLAQQARSGFVCTAKEARPRFAGAPVGMAQNLTPGTIGVPGRPQVTRPSFARAPPGMMQDTRSSFVGVPEFRPVLPNPIHGTNGANAGIRPLLAAAPTLGEFAPSIRTLPHVIGHLGVPLPGHHAAQNVPFHIESSASGLPQIGHLNPQARSWSPPPIDLPMYGSDGGEVTKGEKQKGRKAKEDKTSTPRSERTMFITFSQGYPVKEIELRQFLLREYGKNCIEKIYMQAVPLYMQSLWARIVFASPSTVEEILRGETKARFIINRKHVWARIFVDRDAQSGGTGRSHNRRPSRARGRAAPA